MESSLPSTEFLLLLPRKHDGGYDLSHHDHETDGWGSVLGGKGYIFVGRRGYALDVGDFAVGRRDYFLDVGDFAVSGWGYVLAAGQGWGVGERSSHGY